MSLTELEQKLRESTGLPVVLIGNNWPRSQVFGVFLRTGTRTLRRVRLDEEEVTGPLREVSCTHVGNHAWQLG